MSVRKRLVHIGIVWGVVSAVLSCTPGKFLTPPTGPGTDYPCGYYGVSCFPLDGTHTCCRENYSCVQDGCDYLGNPHTFGAGESAHEARTPEK